MGMRLRASLLVVGLGLVAVVTACGGRAEVTARKPIAAADAVATATVRAGGTPGGTAPVFNDTSPGGQLFGTHCVACHAVKAGGGNIGPSLTTIGTIAATRKPGLEAAAYIKESITSPDAVVTQGFQPGIMPKDFGQKLSAEQIDTLVKYLLEQK